MKVVRCCLVPTVVFPSVLRSVIGVYFRGFMAFYFASRLMITDLSTATVLSHSLTCTVVRQCQLQPTVTQTYSWMQPTNKTYPGSKGPAALS